MANCQAVILSVEDDVGHRVIIEDLLEATRSPEVGMRQAAAIILNIYCSRSKADYTCHLRSLVSGLIRLFNDSSPVVLEESWDALNAITKVRPRGSYTIHPPGSPPRLPHLFAVCRALTHSILPGHPQKLDAGNQLALIDELHKEIRLVGNESKGEHVPGFCLPKKVSRGGVPAG